MATTMTSTPYTPRHQSLIESIAHGEIHYGTQFDGFYFSHVLQFELSAEDQVFLKALYANGEIWHKPIDAFEFEVRLRDANDSAVE